MGSSKGETHTIVSSRSSGLNSQVDVQVIVTEKEGDIEKWQYRKPAYGAVALVMALTAFAVLFPMIITSESLGLGQKIEPIIVPCPDECKATLVESIPENLTYPAGSPVHMSTYEAWKTLISSANKTIDLVSFYWTLRGKDVHFEDPSAWQGEDIYKRLLETGKKEGLKLRIVQEATQIHPDTADFTKQGAAEVRNLNQTALMGGGVLHTKLWVIDRKHVYIGSANMDWRSLTQVKELGILIQNCPCIAGDMSKIFEAYWSLAQPNATLPPYWPRKYTTHFNQFSPLQVQLNHLPAQVFISSSPLAYCARGRTSDLKAILHVIQKAQKFIHIAVMDYFPMTLYSKPTSYWPYIDDALREAAIGRNVEVHLLASHWKHTRGSMPHLLQSLAALDSVEGAKIQVKLFVVPAFTQSQAKIPYARVNHNKYMVTDNTAYIGTSNWAGDYFIRTAGVGLIIQPNTTETTSMQQQLADIFERDWNSTYAKPVTALNINEYSSNTVTSTRPEL